LFVLVDKRFKVALIGTHGYNDAYGQK
jgi:hypothetical protein